jgi:hypothetical protein
MDCSWSALGLLLECSWIAHGVLLDCSGIALGLLLKCSWIALGLFVDCLWIGQGSLMGTKGAGIGDTRENANLKQPCRVSLVGCTVLRCLGCGPQGMGLMLPETAPSHPTAAPLLKGRPSSLHTAIVRKSFFGHPVRKGQPNSLSQLLHYMAVAVSTHYHSISVPYQCWRTTLEIRRRTS